ncbi:MAG: hypothetical protein M1151_01580 [Candidatus Thermoplasmatota archaeon]|nr:hypothetical protein [Candidatus Thermoplasmatota archaeon]
MEDRTSMQMTYNLDSEEICSIALRSLQEDNQGMVTMKCLGRSLIIEFEDVKFSSIYSLCEEILNQMKMVNKLVKKT